MRSRARHPHRRLRGFVAVAATVGVVIGVASVPAAGALPPDPPAAPSVVAGNALIVVTFAPPASDGGSPITGYTASCTSSDGGLAGANTGASSPITVTALTNGKTYTCTVLATNADGDSAPSGVSSAVVPSTVPDAPAAPSVVAGNAQIAVSFVPPASDGGSPITGYTASCTSSDGGLAGANTGVSSPITVAALTNGKTYTCTVLATNADGDSAPSGVSSAVVPSTVPDAPAAPLVVAGNAQIVVTFVAPASDGGSPITSYAASCTSSDGGLAGTNTGVSSPITVAALTNGKTYTCTVLATNVNGDSPPSVGSSAVVPSTVPDAPAAPSVVAGNAQIAVSFVAPASDGGSPITSYAASCTSSDGGLAGTNSGVSSPVTVAALTNGKTYTCTVLAANAVGDSPPSVASSAVVPSTVPDAPAAPSVVPGNAQIVVTFAAPASDGGSAITGYRASCVSSDGGLAGTTTGVSSPITVAALTNGKTYTCTVLATNANGDSPPSVASSAVVPSTVPDAPAAPSIAGGNAQIDVSFAPPVSDGGSPITGYTASCTSSDGGLAGTTTGVFSPITVTALTNGRTYTCTVLATNANGDSPPSVASSAVVPSTVPDAPAAPSIVGGNAQIVVTFAPPVSDGGSPITGYSALCTSSDGGLAGSNTGASSPITVTALTNGKTYTCTVLATNANGDSATSAASGAVVPSTVPDAPAAPSVVPGNALIDVSFAAPASDGGSPITGYSASCTSTNGGLPGSNTGVSSPITVTALTNGSTYTCTVLATNANGGSAASAASSTAVPSTLPDAPAAPSVVAGNTLIAVSFLAPASDGGSPITGYTASCTSTNGGLPGSGTGASSPITVTGLTNGSTYTCTVLATNANGDSAPSVASSAAVPSAVPDAPAAPSVVAGNAQIVVTFAAPASDGGSAITGYTASCASTNGGLPGSSTGASSPITVTALTNGKTYTCTVIATNANGDSPPSTASSAVVPSTVPAAPAAPSVVGGNAQIVVTFVAPVSDGGSPITGYTASCTSTNGGVAGTRAGASSPITVTGLTNGKTYTCRVTATNVRGTSAPSAASPSVLVDALPGAPTVVKVVPGAATSTTGSVSVFFTPGASGGSATTSYTASCTSAGGGVPGTRTGASSPLVVSALTTGQTYSCSVRATNLQGTGPASLAVTVTIGAPAAPVILRVLPLQAGLVIALSPGANNGSPIFSFRARCTSTNGGLPGSPLQASSPIVASNLTTGATYTCRVSANNVWGEGPAAVTAPVVVGATGVPATSCAGSTGTLKATPGLLLASAKPQTLALEATLAACTGTWVSSARISGSVRTSTAVTCRNTINVTSGGSGKLTWSAPAGMGTSGTTLRLVVTSTTGHVTKVHFYGTVTSKANVFTGRHISGNLTLNRGLQSVASGGNCTAVLPLTSFGVTAISFSLS